MTATELKRHLVADLYRYDRAEGMTGFGKAMLREPGFRLTFLLRLCRHLRAQVWSRWGVYHVCKFWLNRLTLKLGVYIDISTEIGPGLFLPHPCGIIINRRCRVGANCNLAQHVTLGLKSREPRAGCPSLGDRVYVGPGAVIIGAIEIGNDAAIGANAVVLENIPPMGVAAGVPAKLVSQRGSEGYINDCYGHPTTSNTP